jgi:hypothetical protein
MQAFDKQCHAFGSTRFGCDVHGMILLCDLRGAMRFDRRKGISVHVSAFSSYDFNALTPVVWKLWR